MKPISHSDSAIDTTSVDRDRVQEVLDEAKRAVEPEYYVQQATGRALTKLVFVVGGLQVGGVVLWLGMFFGGVVDASQNLDGFMIGQLVVFLSSIAVGLVVVVRHLRSVRAESEAMEPRLVERMVELVDPDADEASREDDSWIARITGGAPKSLVHGRFGGSDYWLSDLDADDLDGRGLVMAVDAGLDHDATAMIRPADVDEERVTSLFDDLGLANAKLESVEIEEFGDEGLMVSSTDPEKTRSMLTPAVRKRLLEFHEVARDRDLIADHSDGAGGFVVVANGGEIRLVRLGAEPLSVASDAVDEVEIDELIPSIREIAAAGRLVEAVDAG